MVFAPTRDTPLGPHERTVAPKRRDHLVPPSTSDDGKRLKWRAVVHSTDRDTVHTTWHLAACSAPPDAAAHCPEGQQLLETVGDPDGHCLVEGKCGRCAPPDSPSSS